MKSRILLCIIGFLILAFPLNALGAGACCTLAGCVILDSGACDEGNGSFQGEDTTCGPPDPCQLRPVQAVPTLTEWGLIFLAVFAGLGAVYHLRRQRIAGL